MTTNEQKALTENHAAQLRGVDYQRAAVEAAELYGGPAIYSGPSEDCPCEACQSHDWDEED